MAHSHIANLLDLSEQELKSKSRELRQQLFMLRLEKATARLEKTHKLQTTRRDIARCQTRLIQLARESNLKES